MNVEVSFPVEFSDQINKYLYEKHADIGEMDEDMLVRVLENISKLINVMVISVIVGHTSCVG